MTKNVTMVAALLALMNPGAAMAEMVLDMWAFQSPSHNINCYPADDGINCLIFDQNWDIATLDAFPLGIDECGVDESPTLFLTAGGVTRANMTCHGDVFYPDDSAVLDYGETIQMNGLGCQSFRSGMTCINDDGHGFKINNSLAVRF